MKNLLLLVALLIAGAVNSQITYTWNVAGGSSWATAGNWTPTRTTPAATDILIINNGGTKTITNVPTQTIGRLTISGNTTVTLSGGGGTQTLTIANGTGTDLVVTNGSTLTQNANLENITLSANCTADISGTFIVNGTYNNNATGTVTTVTGKVENAGVITSNTAARLLFNASSIYEHSRNGGNVPTATWHSSSTCLITGITSNLLTGLDQSLGNVEWNCSSQSASFNFSGMLTTVTGNLTITDSDNYGLFMENTANSIYTLTIGGNFTLSGSSWFGITNGNNITATMNVGSDFILSNGFFDFHIATGGGIALNKIILNVAGNYSQSGGTFDFAYGNSNTTNFTELRLLGNLSVTGSGIMTTSTTDGDISNGLVLFNNSTVQLFTATTVTNIQYANFTINGRLQLLSDRVLASNSNAGWGDKLVVNSGGTIDFGSNRLVSSTGATAGVNNSFTLSAGAEAITANQNGFQQNTSTGSVSTAISNRSFSSSANYIYNGTTVQNSGLFTTSPVTNQVNNLTVNNTDATYGSTGVTLQQPFAIAGTATFTAGLITSSSTNLLTFNDNAIASGANNNILYPSFVNGPVRKIGNDAFIFPVGKLNAGYRLIGISAPTIITDAFTAEFIRGSSLGLGAITATGLQAVSACERWSLVRTGTSVVNVTLSWNGLSPCNMIAYVNNASMITVASFNGTSWNQHGASSYVGGAGAGTVTLNSINYFNQFTLGTTSVTINPLTVKFTGINAYHSGNKNTVEWTNNAEENIKQYEVEKSPDGISFQVVKATNARSNNGSKQTYTGIDDNPVNGVVYYRIKATELNNTIFYSSIVKLISNSSNKAGLAIYPNPITNGQFNLQLNNLKVDDYQVRIVNSSGQVVYTNLIKHSGGTATRSIDLPTGAKAGIYYLQLTGTAEALQTKILVQ